MAEYHIDDFKYLESLSAEENLKRACRAFESLPPPEDLVPSKHIGNACVDGNRTRYGSIHVRFSEQLEKLQDVASQTGYEDETVGKKVKGAFRPLCLMFEIIVSRDIFSYSPEVIAELWLRDNGTIIGSAVDSELQPIICAHLYRGGYGLAPMISSNWTSFDKFDVLSDLFRTAFKQSKMSAFENLSEVCRQWFHALPDEITVYRGCERSSVDGLSWTTDRTVADKFAYGRHGARLADPVIATTRVKKADVFYASNLRNEFEIVHDPRDCDVQVEPFIFSKSSLAR